MNFQEFVQYIFLAIVQGISEVLPISSSGHLQVLQYVFDMDISNLTLSIFLHIGSLLAVIIFYWSTLKTIIIDFFVFIFNKKKRADRHANFKLLFLLCFSSIPAGIAGFILKKHIENIFQDIFFIGLSLIVTAIFLYSFNAKKQTKSISQLSFIDAIIIGLFQVIGIIPGISRSGITLSGAKHVKLNNEDSAKYAFLMFIPVAVGSLFSEFIDYKNEKLAFNSALTIPYIIGIIVSGIFTYISLKYLLKIIKKGKLWFFSIYCFLAGILIISLSFIK